MKKIDVILADDHPINSEGLQKYLEGTGRYQVLGKANDYASLEYLLETTKPNIAVVDIDMPPSGTEGEVILERLVGKFSKNVSFVVLSMFEKIPLAKRLKSKGLKGYLIKLQQPKEIEEHLWLHFTKKRHAFHRSILEKIFNEEVIDSEKIQLSPREIEVIKLLCKGHSKETRKKYIAKLGMTEHTFYTHRSRIYRKVGISNAKELIHIAYKRGIINNEEMLE